MPVFPISRSKVHILGRFCASARLQLLEAPVSGVRCHVSRVTCQVSRVRHNFFLLFLDKVVELVGEGSVINGAYPVLFI